MTASSLRICLLLIFFLRCSCTVELECGEQYDPQNTLIGGGREVDKYEHPWFCDYDVINFDGKSKHCGGTLVSHEYIVTAAHCFDHTSHHSLPSTVINLKCGAKNNRTFLTVKKIIKHPQWTNTVHDIAVIQIRQIGYSTTLRPACVISSEELLVHSKVTVVGTGDTHFSFGRPKHAQTADIYLKDVLLCQKKYDLGEKFEQNNLCAGARWTAVKSGDEGGPLLVLYNMRYYLVGVISTRKGNFITDFYQNMSPVVFTKIKAECEFFKEHTDFECYNNLIPLKESDKNKHVCGHTTVLSNGTTLHPWYCRIYDTKGVDFCGATLISFSHAITAAHCVKSEEHQLDLRTSYIKCGLKWELGWLKKITISSGYNAEYINNDIAVLEFEVGFQFNENITPICFFQKDYILNKKMMAIGVHHNHHEERVISEIPGKMIHKSYCLHSGLQGINNTICMKMENHTIHNRDIGGPLVTIMPINGEPKYFITGIILQSNKETNAVSTIKVQNFDDFIFNTTTIQFINTADHLELPLLTIFMTSLTSIIFQKLYRRPLIS